MKRKFDYILEDVYRELINAICANDGSKILSLITDYPELIDKVNQGWYEPLFLAVKLCDSSIFKIIKKAKINLSVVDKGGENVLHLAINNNRLDIIKYLLSIEQDLELLNTKDNDGHTALHIAVEVGNLEIIKLLLDAGADITAVNDDGEDVLYIATNSNALDIVKYLLSIPQILDLLNVQNKETALHLAARDNNLKMLQLMVGAGADITAVNDDGENVLHIVARIKELNFAEYIITRNGTIDQDIEKITANRDKALDIVKYLLMQGLIINKSDKYIKTVNDLIGISEDIMKIAQNEKPEKFVGNYSSQENLNFAAIFFTERFKTGTIKYDSFSDIEKRISDNDLLNKQENLLLKNVLTARIAELTKDVINLLYMIEHEIISIDPSSTNQKSNYTKLLSQKYNSNDSTLDQEKDIESSLIISLIAMFNGKEDGINPLAQTMSLTDIEIKTLQGKNSPVDNIYITTMINLKQNILNLQKYLLPSNKICSAFNNVINSYNKVQDTEFTCIASQDTPIEYSSMLIGIESQDSAR